MIVQLGLDALNAAAAGVTTTPVGWNPVAAAPTYSTLAGVMGIGALTAIVLTVTLREKDKRKFNPSLPPLLVSLPSLLAASLLFAELGGEEIPHRRFPEALYAGAVLALGGILLFVGLAWLISE